MNIFSERELKVIKILGRKKLTLRQLTEELFKTGEVPFDPAISVSNSIRRIVKKCDYYKLDWTLDKTRENKKLLIRKITI